MQNAILSAPLLKQQITDFHAQSVKNGFYDDYPKESRKDEEYICSRAMLISCEIGEAYEAYRSGKIDADNNVSQALSKGIDVKQDDIARYVMLYEEYVKGTVAEELADTYIRLCCVAGSVGISAAQDISEELFILKKDHQKSGIHACFLRASQAATFSAYKPIHTSDISQGIAAVYFLADKLNIDLHLHVKLKAFYNTTREYKHGRNF
jgi:NTP pyrophosphatase (non-canonical NTP hydrolase)